MHSIVEAACEFVRDLAGDLPGQVTFAALEEDTSFHGCYSVSPAAGKNGAMSTVMSFRRMVTAAISGVDTPYFVSKRWARASWPRVHRLDAECAPGIRNDRADPAGRGASSWLPRFYALIAIRMIIECPGCHSKYQYDEERFEKKASKKIKCARCQQIFEIHHPALQGAAPVQPGDGTAARKTEIPRVQESTEQSPLPQRAEGQAAVLQLPTGKRLSLAVLDGPDAGTVFRIDRPRVTIGRAAADLTLNDTEASRQHAALAVRDHVYTVEDLGSTNGTLVDGEKIAGPVELTDKSEFRVGATTLMLIVTEDH